MYRARIEALEVRKLFSVTDLIIDPFGLVSSAPAVETAGIVDYIDPDEIATGRGTFGRTESVGKDEAISIGAGRMESVAAGDVNGDGLALLVGTDGGIWKNRISHTWDSDLHVAALNFVGDKITLIAQHLEKLNQDIEVENDETHASTGEGKLLGNLLTSALSTARNAIFEDNARTTQFDRGYLSP
jgi:hypothetical protein